MSKRPKIVFLYSEIAGYFVSCVNELVKTADVLIIRWPVNSEAPFEFDISDSIECFEKSEFNYTGLLNKVKDFKPDTIVCSGWMDKDYLKIIGTFNKKINTVLTLDNHWTGHLKQRLAGMLSPFFLRNKFTHAWVPGNPQKKFAQKLGFKNIIKGFYCADVDLYNKIYDAQNQTFDKTILYVGRYVKHKGIFELWNAFIELQNEQPNEWKLKCIGTGEEWDNRIEHDKITHLGFVQPKDIKSHLKDKCVYVLPSKFEPWGVTVHEFAVASCPLILSSKVGAHEMFLRDGENGVLLESVTKDSLKKALKSITSKSDNELMKMSQKSHEMGMSYTPSQWSERLLNITKH